MRVVGLTGGIGAGKSTVAGALAARGATVLDADRIAREVVEPNGPAFAAVAARFGPAVVGPDGRLDRAALAAVVFSDPEALRDLNALTHPAIGRILAERLEAARRAGAAREASGGPAPVVVLDVPLLTPESARAWGVDAVVVVDAPVEVAVRRLVDQRGLPEGDARARVAAQVSRQERLALADRVVDNSGTPEELEAEVDRLWAWLTAPR